MKDITNCDRNDILKVIALITMIIDHIGAILLPNLIWLRIIGRLSFPIYAYFISIGFTNTRNLSKYMLRLLSFLIISQAPYYLLFGAELNILFTLIYGLLVLCVYDKSKMLGLCLISPTLYIPQLDYGFYGVCTILVFYVFKDKKYTCIVAQTILTLILNYNTPLQLYCLIALPLIFMKHPIHLKVNKYVFYICYPLHLWVIAIISLFCFTQ